MPVDLETYEGQIEQLDLNYVREVGEYVRVALFPTPKADGRQPISLPVAIPYQPGNGTRYDLVFVSGRSIQQADLGIGYVPSGCFYEGQVLPGVILVTMVNGEGFSYAFDLSFGNGQHVNYIAGKTGLNLADASAITALFRAITGVDA